MTSWKKLKQLPLAELRMLVSAVFLLPLINLLLGVLGYSRLHRILEKLAPLRESQPQPFITNEALLKAKSAARMVAIAANYGVYRATCLRKSLLVFWLLRRQGIAGMIRFGVRLDQGNLEAHAWVEWQDIVINDEADVRQRYAPLENGIPQTQAGL
jgi:hypothetical protein